MIKPLLLGLIAVCFLIGCDKLTPEQEKRAVKERSLKDPKKPPKNFKYPEDLKDQDKKDPPANNDDLGAKKGLTPQEQAYFAALKASKEREKSEQKRQAEEQEAIDKTIEQAYQDALKVSALRDKKEKERAEKEQLWSENEILKAQNAVFNAAHKALKERDALELQRIRLLEQEPEINWPVIAVNRPTPKIVAPMPEVAPGYFSQMASALYNLPQKTTSTVTSIGTYAVQSLVGQTLSDDLLNLADNPESSKAFVEFFKNELQPSLEELGLREVFSDRVLKPILFPRSSLVSITSSSIYSLMEEQPSPAVSLKLIEAYQKWHFRLEKNAPMLERWNRQEQALDDGLGDGIGFLRDIGNGAASMERITRLNQRWDAFKRSAANKITSHMSDADARAEASRWFDAFKYTVIKAIGDQADQNLGLSTFLQLAYELSSNSSTAENLVSSLLVPAIKKANSELNERYIKGQVVEGSLNIATSIINAPIAAYIGHNHPEVMAFFNDNFGFLNKEVSGFMSELPSAEHVIADLDYLRSFFMWKSIQASIFQYISSIIYLTESLATVDAEGRAIISFDRIIKAHLSRKTRRVPLAIDQALDSLFLLTGEKRQGAEQFFFGSLAALELARKTSYLTTMYPSIRKVLLPIFGSAYWFKESAVNWWSLPPGEMGILIKFAMANAQREAGIINAPINNDRYLARAALNSQVSKIQQKNVMKAMAVGSGKVALATFTSPFSALFMGLSEISKIGGALASAPLGGHILSKAFDKAGADQAVSDATFKTVTYIQTFLVSLYGGYQNVPAQFKAQFLPVGN